MAEVKWIKITTDMFDNRKIKHLRRLPEGNNIVLLWVMLLTLAGRCNAGGMIFLTENIPYTPKMLADELDLEENTVVFGLQALEQLNMIVMDNGFFAISGWNEYQNIEGMDKIREQNRLRKQRQRAKAALPPADGHVKSRDSHATDKDKDKDKDIDRDIEGEEKTAAVPPAPLADFSNTTFSDEMKAMVESWIKYKKERRETYKPIGLSNLISEIQNNVNKYGEEAVMELMRQCMAANYRGIIFDRLKEGAKKNGKGNNGSSGGGIGKNYPLIGNYV